MKKNIEVYQIRNQKLTSLMLVNIDLGFYFRASGTPSCYKIGNSKAYSISVKVFLKVIITVVPIGKDIAVLKSFDKVPLT